ncbi:23S rRNA (adenine(1618)-N(6))-methyltransferase RlmF [Limnobacter sp.]|uniref:23S rRNA (adenine(1618)-N(6))-methyltransferase RlmF n=1 Tax=Limnobacter sp. TaxID=2003368 RepID=UPI002FE363EE
MNKAFHPKNLHNEGYDFTALASTYPALKKHVKPNKYGSESIDFADPAAVKALNSALLKHHYGIEGWNVPDGYLCPPIPGRVDYIHYVADLLSSVGIVASDSRPVRMLDIGTGANGIYSLLAAQVHGWQCTGTEIDQAAMKNLAAVLDKNEALKHLIDLRLQRDKRKIFDGVIKPGERFDLSVCNPPFHASQKEAMKSNQRKVNSLAFNRGEKPAAKSQAALNFGGQKNELWCEGGESGFLQTMINESAQFGKQCKWFTTLISKAENVAPAKRLIRNVGARDVLEVEMEQGNKTTRIVAWTF